MTISDHASFAAHSASADTAMKLFPAVYDAAQEEMAAAYPAKWCQFGHHLSGHPLLGSAAIAQLATRLPAHHVAIRGGKAGLSVAELLAQMERGTASVELRDIDRDPRYDLLMRDVLGELKPVIAKVTGAMREPAASLVIAAPHTSSPLRFDPAFTIHFQLSGSRSVTSFADAEQSVIAPVEFERALCEDAASSSAARTLEWNDDLAPLANRRDPAPSEALYAPAFAPHLVRVHEEMSVSLALSWNSRWSIQFAEACRFNARLRARGASPDAARPFPGRNWVRSYAWRAWQQWDWAKERLRRERAAWA